MKQGKSLTQLAQEIERRANSKTDFVAPVGQLRMGTQDNNVVLAVGDQFNGQLNTVAHGQLAEYTGIPKAYYDRMVVAAPELLADNVNRWLPEQQKDRRMVRTLDGAVRALLSDKYRPLENEDLAEAVLPILLDMDLDIMSCEITDRRAYIKAVDKRLKLDVPTGRKWGDGTHTIYDTCAPAIIISNSEVGLGRLLIETGVYTRACTNLAMLGANFKKNHVGGRSEISEEVYALLSDQTKRITDAAVWGQVRDVVRGAFEAVKFQQVVDKLSNAAEDKITTDPVQVIERFGRKNQIGQDVRSSILRHLIEGADLSRYGLHAAVSRAAQDVEAYDDATDMERLSGNIIELPRNEWAELLKAA